jgi:superfamily II DNA or RNA helicase
MEGDARQYVGRLHRLHPGKREAFVYDYIDEAVPVLKRRKQMSGSRRAEAGARDRVADRSHNLNDPLLQTSFSGSRSQSLSYRRHAGRIIVLVSVARYHRSCRDDVLACGKHARFPEILHDARALSSLAFEPI